MVEVVAHLRFKEVEALFDEFVFENHKSRVILISRL